MNTPVFSVIIPVYNVAKYLERTLQSVYKQTFGDYEIVIIDDGSTDRTAEILSKQADARLRVFHQSNSGVSVARNKGIREARGEFIAFLDGDDIWVCNHLEIALKFFRDYPEYKWFYTRPSMVSVIDDKLVASGIKGKVEYRAVNWFLGASNDPMSSSCIIRKSAICHDELFPLGIKMYEDNVAWCRIAMQHPAIGVANCSTVQYRMRDTSASHNYSVKMLGRDSSYNGAFICHQELYLKKDCTPAAKLFFRFYSLLNWWGRIRGCSLLSWKDEIRQRKALNGAFLTSWLLAGAYVNHFFCLCYAKIVRLLFNAVVRKMKKLSPLYEVELGVREF
ncbi:MAG: glycosyltransferase family 2 protein [Akkermansia sp.]|nr:glycosyltransferase family 2 protein [Akkermansia sp.]